ncbi:hypothetical protein [Sphingobium sp. YBL2]|uniref:hypothetical protein n=1 Tax=Sphingobium sp. (strain YBL2) TaxID=484429 RepID=UPI00307CC123
MSDAANAEGAVHEILQAALARLAIARSTGAPRRTPMYLRGINTYQTYAFSVQAQGIAVNDGYSRQQEYSKHVRFRSAFLDHLAASTEVGLTMAG